MKRVRLWALIAVIFAGAGSLSLALAVAEDSAHKEAPKKEESHKEEAAKAAPEKSAENKADAKGELHADASGAQSEAKAAAPVKSRAISSSGCLVDEFAIEDVKRRRAELDAKSKELAAKEEELKSKERALTEELKKLTAVRDEIDQRNALLNKQNEEKIAKLVETLETMSPKPAAQLLSNVDETLAVAAISKMSTPKLAKIMAQIQPDKSSKLTEAYAGVVRAKGAAKSSTLTASNDAAATATNSEKGGGNNNGNNERNDVSNKSNESSSRQPASK